MTPLEAAAAAQELADRLHTIATLDLHPIANATALQDHYAECGDLVGQLGGYLLIADVPA